MMLENLYVYAAIGGGLFLLVQFGLMLLGMGDDLADAGSDLGGFDGDTGGDAGGDFDADTQPHDHWTNKVDGEFDTGGADAGGAAWFFEIFSLRSLSGGALFFGLVGKTALIYGAEPQVAIAYAGLAGFAALYAVYWVFKQVFKLETSGNEDIRNALGLPAKVYVPVPPAGQGAGKVQFKMQDRLVEYLAVAEGDTRLSTGQQVVVVDIVDARTVCVAPDEAA